MNFKVFSGLGMPWQTSSKETVYIGLTFKTSPFLNPKEPADA